MGATAGNLAGKAQALYLTNPLVLNGVENLIAEMIGPGIRPAPIHDDPEVRAEALGRWDRYAPRFDFEGLSDAYGFQTRLMRSVILTGDGFAVRKLGSPDLRWHLLDSAQVDRTLTRELPDGNSIVQGVEFNAAGHRVAYWISPRPAATIFESWAQPVRVDAAEVLHVFKPLLPGQVRGISWASSVVGTAAELTKLMEALVMAANVSSMFVGAITTETDFAGPDDDPIGDASTPSLEPGTMLRLKGGQRVTFSSPQQLNAAVDILRAEVRAIGAGLGVPAFLVDGDLSTANYSSLRAGLIPLRRKNEAFIYGTLVPQFLNAVWSAWSLIEELEGRPTPRTCEWIAPAAWQVDPQKAVDADVAEIDAGLASRREKVAARGWSVEQIDDERAADAAREKELGLSKPAPAAPKDNGVQNALQT
ncbi:phage portal protein [Labrys sp. WJW]|nr:phage portal protein [Labrys sp. WJW]